MGAFGDLVKIRLIHVLHSTVVLAVLVQLGFAAAFLVDKHSSDHAYSQLAANHVRVPAQVQSCGRVTTAYRGGTSQLSCRVTYSYAGKQYYAVIPEAQPKAFYVDPQDPSNRMNVGYFEGGPTAHTADTVFASLLIFGAALVTGVHLLHLRRRRRWRGRRSRRAAPSTLAADQEGLSPQVTRSSG